MMPNTNNGDQAYDEFVGRLVYEKGLEDEDRRQNGRIREELMSQIDGVVQDAMLEALSLEQAKELEKLLDAEVSDEELDGFFAGTGIDFGKVAAEAMGKFREDYLGGNSTNMTSYNTNNAQGQPMQGAISEAPGASNVEGVAHETTVKTEEA